METALLTRLGQRLEKILPVHIIQVDVPLAIPGAQDVVNRPGIFHSQLARHLGPSLPTSREWVKLWCDPFSQKAPKLYEHPANQLIAQVQAEHIQALGKSLGRLEKAVLACAREIPLYERLLTLPGVGRILGLTITMEVGEIGRFKTDGDFASYCRLVDAKRLSHGKVKAENNAKCGNKYLAWAFVEAANFARRHDEQCRRWDDRKAAKTSKVIATKALGCKLAKAAWHVMAKPCDYDPKRMFPELATQTMSKR